jgi:hypothetical protein
VRVAQEGASSRLHNATEPRFFLTQKSGLRAVGAGSEVALFDGEVSELEKEKGRGRAA